ncbi:hypothetical protein IWW34DRAFT_803680 [Fusarium oxysporum f. sp. albedinis]|nr:hypothetical protein IWW34DRAFT_803680 [Fusarium oxysporum f. sp. albedinis]
MTNSNLSASFTLTTYLILGICSGVWLCIVLTCRGWSSLTGYTPTVTGTALAGLGSLSAYLLDEQRWPNTPSDHIIWRASQNTSLFLGQDVQANKAKSIIMSFNLALGIIMCYFVRRKRHLPDDEAIELTEIKPNLDRGMLVEIISIYRDGIEIYTRDKSPASQRLYYHPSLQDPEQAHMHLHDVPIPPERSMQDLRRELSAGLRLVQRYYNNKQ